jgi:hypothetical protein
MKTLEQKGQKLRGVLAHCTGTERWYEHWTGRLHYTDGVYLMAETAGAHWLIDLVASYNRQEPFQVWTLRVDRSAKREIDEPMAVVTMQEDSNQPIKVTQGFGYTDFPVDEFKLYLIDGILLLPSEY